MSPESPKNNSERTFTFEELQPYLEKIVIAIQNAPLDDEADVANMEAESIDVAYLQGKEEKEILENRPVAYSNSVGFPDVETFIATFASNEILKRFLSPEQIKEIADHESDHIREAQKHGYTTEMGVEIVKTRDGHLRFSPFVTVSVDFDGGNEDEIRYHLKDIAGAPENLSDSDKKKM